MNDIIQHAKHVLLGPTGLDINDLERVFSHLQGRAIDNADLYFQSIYQEGWSLEDSMVKDASYAVERGVGVRAVSGEKTGFAYSDEIALPALDEAVVAARSIALLGQQGSLALSRSQPMRQLYPMTNPLPSITEQ
ncbi:MAG: metalloprotease TldD, partial [Gammaproteobacteria bacterium]|nr:metalloprotease TldD [Gammaproteobacteria bacterium]